MCKKQMTEDDFKYVMEKHKDLILYFTCTEELKYEQDTYGFSINIWGADLYGDIVKRVYSWHDCHNKTIKPKEEGFFAVISTNMPLC